MCPIRRKASEADLYHVTCRGVARRVLFECEEDRRFLGKLLRKNLGEYEVELFAWCFMSNHVHLLLHANLETISAFMQKTLRAYAVYFNGKYDRVGHLFQGRFGSVAITTDSQLMTAVRYIHRNPSEIPGLSYETYKWSSYLEYLNGPFISSTDFVMSIFGTLDAFVRFHKDWHNVDDSYGKPQKQRLDDIDAIAKACELLGVETLASIPSLAKPERDAKLAQLKKAGFPISQIARITETSRNIVQRAK